jgi:hypothetical protein
MSDNILGQPGNAGDQSFAHGLKCLEQTHGPPTKHFQVYVSIKVIIITTPHHPSQQYSNWKCA